MSLKARTLAIAGAAALSAGIAFAGSAQAATVIELTQTGCQFVESEGGIDHGYSPSTADDCKEINAENGEERAAKTVTLRLKPGKHIFRVTNENVPYELGFWLRGDGVVNRLRLPSVSGGGLTQGETKDYAIDLEPGEYLYSCPLNPTLDYKLVVEG